MSWNTKTWSWVKKLLAVNPLVTDGMPVVGKFRTPAVGSQPETYQYPTSAASNVSANYYFQRDARRNYPRLAVYTQSKVAGLLDGSAQSQIAQEAGSEALAVETENVKPLVDVLNTRKLYSVQTPAPTPNWGRRPDWKISEDFVPPNDGSYFPMRVFTA